MASSDARFSTLVSAVQAAGLVETLSGPGPFTVFAPTNAAFAALPAGALDALLADPEQLKQVLTYHVVAGRIPAAEVQAGTWIRSAQGASIKVRGEAGILRVNGAVVTATDIEASNGVIHVIDAVITPPTIAELAAGEPELSTLVTALAQAELVDTFRGEGTFTVFAPTNAAFSALPAGALEAVLADRATLTSVLTYHVLDRVRSASDLTSGATESTLQGASVSVSRENGGVKINDANVIAADIFGTNGVVHVIDAVLLPPSWP